MRNQLRAIGSYSADIADKIGRRLGVNFFPRTWPCEFADITQGRARIFDRIYDSNFWGTAETRSGWGSDVEYTRAYRKALGALIEKTPIESIFDAPCGDLNWMRSVVEATGVKFMGGDVSSAVVEEARRRFPGADVRVFDICEDPFPNAQLWHCRTCLFHLSFKDIERALKNYVSAGIPWALITTHKARIVHKNLDIETGEYRILDLERPPINLPRARRYLKDFKLGRDFPRYSGLWPRSAIVSALDNWTWDAPS